MLLLSLSPAVPEATGRGGKGGAKPGGAKPGKEDSAMALPLEVALRKLRQERAEGMCSIAQVRPGAALPRRGGAVRGTACRRAWGPGRAGWQRHG